MFGWGKKKQGFEWHKYVRTTILVRREKRRQKVDDVRQAAAEQLAQAKVRGKQAAASGAQAAGDGLKSAGLGLFSAMKVGALHSSRGLATFFRFVGDALWRGLSLVFRGVDAGRDRISPALRSGLRLLATPRLAVPFGVVALAAAVGAAGRVYVVGFDNDALVATIVAGVMMTLALLPALTRSSDFERTRSGFGFAKFVGGGSGRVLVSLALLAAVVGGAWAGVRYGYVSVPQFNIALPVLVAPKPAKTMKGRAAVLSGDSIWLTGKIVKFDGIDAPESAQTCHRAGWRRPWRCGVEAKNALYKLTRRRTIVCAVVRTDDGGREVARCSVGDTDLGAEMVKKGLAFAERGMFGARYGDQEAHAKAEKLGVWRGDVVHPSDYRSEKWAAAKGKAPDGCPIKGRVSRGSRVYVLPWSPNYPRLKLSKARGERWFCSEAEARAAGFRPSEKS